MVATMRASYVYNSGQKYSVMYQCATSPSCTLVSYQLLVIQNINFYVVYIAI